MLHINKHPAFILFIFSLVVLHSSCMCQNLLYVHVISTLKVLDLSFNMLTSLEPLMYLSLRKFGTDVTLDGNKWQCDCSMRSVRRRMVYDSNRGLQAWSMVCASPSNLSGRELVQVEENELNCFSMENVDELLQDVTVHRGSEILLTCSAQGKSQTTALPGLHSV